jgi:hypothetical protein
MLNRTNLTGNISNTISKHDTANVGILSNLGYLMVLIIINEMIMLKISAKYRLYIPLRYNVANINAIPGIGNPMKSFVSILSAMTLYLVNLKTPHITINRLTIIVIG